MTPLPSDRPVSALRARMIEDMKVRGFSEKTRNDYIRNVRAFAAFVGRSPDTATAEDLRRFQHHQAQAGVRPPSINSAVAALRFFFTVTLDRPDLARRLRPPFTHTRVRAFFVLTRRLAHHFVVLLSVRPDEKAPAIGLDAVEDDGRGLCRAGQLLVAKTPIELGHEVAQLIIRQLRDVAAQQSEALPRVRELGSIDRVRFAIA